MTGISGFEKVILLITAVFFLLTGGWFVSRSHMEAEYRIATMKQEQLPFSAAQKDENGWPDSLLEGERINLNTARVKDLERLPGIGEKCAREIIAFRELYGGFQSVEELLYISDIGQATLDGLRPYVCIGT